MKTINTLKSELKDLSDRRESLIQEIILKFQEELESLKREYRNKIKRIRISINNHEFNDGESTYFGFYYEDMTITFFDDNEDGRRLLTSDEDELPENLKDVVNKLIKFFGDYDVEDLYERVYGGEYEEVEIDF